MGRSSEGPADGVPGQQERAAWGAAAREEEGRCRKPYRMLSSFDLNTTEGQRDAARLRSSSGGPAWAFQTAIPGGRMTIGNDIVVSVWHRLGHHVPADVAPTVQMQCRSCCGSRTCNGLREGSQDDPVAP